MMLYRNDPGLQLLSSFVLQQKPVRKLQGQQRAEDHPSCPGELDPYQLPSSGRTPANQLHCSRNFDRTQFWKKTRQPPGTSPCELRERCV